MIGSKKQNILLLTVICCATLALISIAYASLSSTLKVAGQASVAAQSWDIDFTNTVGTKWTTAQSLTGTKTNLAELPTSSSGAFGLPLDQTASGFLGSLRMSGDKITYTWYVQNFGTFEAKYSISGLISTGKYLSGSNVDISCNTSDNSSDKTFCNNYVKTTLTIDGVVADASSSYTLAKAGQTGDSSTLVLTIEIIGDNQIYTATASAYEDKYNNANPSMLLGGIEMLDSSNDLNISVTGLTLSGTQSVVETTTEKITTTKSYCENLVDTEWLFDYSGEEETFEATCAGTYKLEVWGAQGGSTCAHTNCNTLYYGGYGAYATGDLTLDLGSKLFINVGGKGTYKFHSASEGSSSASLDGGYNGGGDAYYSYGSYYYTIGSGGGATHIATTSGLLFSLENSKDSILIVAAGGGGGLTYYDQNSPEYSTIDYAGNGGGIEGNSPLHTNYGSGYTNRVMPSGGTQSHGGYSYCNNNSNICTEYSGLFGRANDTPFGSDIAFSGAGGGFYGGAFGPWNGASGGSSYIGNSSLSNKAMYCYNCTESSEESTKTFSVTNVSETATANYAKQGNGYAKITYLG